ncbi:MAG: carbamoyl phosphate synthase small subunit, partial [Eubacteriales bacterium]
TPTQKGLEIIKNTPVPHDAVSRVSTKNIKKYDTENAKHHVVAIDCGMKQNIVRSLTARGCRVTVVPFNTAAEDIETLCPDGIFLSNGPGDPTDVPETIAAVRALMGKYPMFGICLGHQIISLAVGGKTYKLKFGHRGGNHSVLNIEKEKIEITSQNHSYAVDAESLAHTPLTVTHINLLDNTVEGVASIQKRVFSVQYHPESAPGPEEGTYLFDKFISLMEETDHA